MAFDEDAALDRYFDAIVSAREYFVNYSHLTRTLLDDMQSAPTFELNVSYDRVERIAGNDDDARGYGYQIVEFINDYVMDRWAR